MAGAAPSLRAQATGAAATPAAARVMGTVSSVTEGSLAIKPDAKGGQGDEAAVTVTLDAGAKVLRLAPGSTDLKTAEPAQASDIAVGDRVLALGAAGATPAEFSARRIVLMKSTAIAERNQATAAEWQKGSGGIVTAIDPAQSALTLMAGARSLTVHTSGTTLFRRYSQGSVRFADATKSTFAEIHTGDQVRVRGTRAGDGSSVDAIEIVSGKFEHLSGTILSIDSAARQLTLKDLRTKRVVTVELAQDSSIHNLPPDVAERLAARAKRRSGEAQPGGAKGGAPPAAPASRPAPAEGASGEESPQRGGEQRGGDLNQVVARLPETPVSDLHKGAAVMIVAMPKEAADHVVAVTLLAGVEPILAASPNGDAGETLSPWNLGAMPEGGS